MPDLIPLVTIDGPAGAGKSTVARELAAALGWTYLDSGALYRTVALAAQRSRIDPTDARAAADLTDRVNIRLVQDGKSLRVYLNDEEVTDLIRTEAVGRLASDISKMEQVRRRLTDLQRRLGGGGKVVLEGRDAGTVVFPLAAVKFFLTADPLVRAQRRLLDLKKAGVKTTLEEVSADMAARDEQDSNRKLAPLKPASDAVIIDSSGLNLNQVIDRLTKEVKIRLPQVLI